MNVEIFITTKFTGKVTNGAGAYAILLQMAGEENTAKIHAAGWKGLSYQKLNVKAVVDAISYMTAPANIHITLDNAYAEHMIEKGNAVGNAYRELWERYYKKAAKMDSVTVERTRHPYTEKLLEIINAGKYPVTKEAKE